MGCGSCGRNKVKGNAIDRRGNYYDKYRYLKPNQLRDKKSKEEQQKKDVEEKEQ